MDSKIVRPDAPAAQTIPVICPDFGLVPNLSKPNLTGNIELGYHPCLGESCGKYDWCRGPHSAKAMHEERKALMAKIVEGLKALDNPFIKPLLSRFLPD